MTDKDLLEKAIYWFKVIAEDMERISAGNLPHNVATTKGRAIRAYEFLEKHKGEEPVSKDLEEAARKAATRNSHIDGDKFFPNDYWLFKKGAQWQKERIIDKACKWLSNLPLEDMTYKYNDFDSSENWYEFIDDFRKAMEEKK